MLANFTLIRLTDENPLLSLTDVVKVGILPVIYIRIPLLEVFFFVEHDAVFGRDSGIRTRT